MRRKVGLALLSFVFAMFAFGGGVVVLAQSSNTSGGDIIVQTIPGPTVAQKITERSRSSWSWYLSRGSGLVAAIALFILMLSGIGLITGGTFKFLEPLTAWASHRALGIAFGVAVLVHIFSLLFDKFVPFSLAQLFVPWLSSYKPVSILGQNLGSFWIALGVLAFYVCAVIIITSLVWVDKKPHTWKIIHLFSYLVMLMVFVHALYLGTDLAHGIARWLWVGFAASIAVATVLRLWRANTT